MPSTHSNLVADGPTDVHTHHTPSVTGVQITVADTIGNGELVVEQRCDDGTWRAMPYVFNEPVVKVIHVASGTLLRGVLSGSTAPNLYVEFSDMYQR